MNPEEITALTDANEHRNDTPTSTPTNNSPTSTPTNNSPTSTPTNNTPTNAPTAVGFNFSHANEALAEEYKQYLMANPSKTEEAIPREFVTKAVENAMRSVAQTNEKIRTYCAALDALVASLPQDDTTTTEITEISASVIQQAMSLSKLLD
jgi:hypothetical protein